MVIAPARRSVDPGSNPGPGENFSLKLLMLFIPIHERFPLIVHLDVYLENGQRIYFNPNNLKNQIENPRNIT